MPHKNATSTRLSLSMMIPPFLHEITARCGAVMLVILLAVQVRTLSGSRNTRNIHRHLHNSGCRKE